MAEKKIRINWKQEGVGKTFLESCIHEIALHGREGSSLKAISWKRVAEKLKIEHDFIVDQKQMKNRYDYLKSKFAAWSKLKNKTGNVYNPQTNTFNLTEEEWQLESKFVLDAKLYKYYLCDAAYTNTRGFMTPYRNTRYWLADFRRQRALTKEEKFNHAHAQLRNVIERAYGVLKARFPILKQMAPFSFPIQRDMVIAYFAIHNFIRKWNIHDQLFVEYNDNTFFGEMQQEESDGQSVHDMEWGSQGIEYMTTLRDEIATQLMSNA
ncbi:putative Myb/SANT-like domain, harbinger transposase-derived nuclease domain-containing protein [Helianthus annuus]|nr:putative Myb/SANT-like domain, harbinger transposase-derived nuclease domain-containing protein [Helianthus annuus]